jgi:hypothetical protein
MNSVLAAINDDVLEGDKQAEFLLDQLDQEFISATMFLADLTNMLKKLINIFQLENLSVSKFSFHLNNTIREITSEFIGYEEVQPNYGTIFNNYLNESGNSVPSFVKEYSLAIINAVENRFPESELYFSFKIFDPKELPDNERDLFIYGINEVEFLDKFYGEDKSVDGNQFCGIIEKGELIKEWDSVKIYLKCYKNTELEFIQLWKYILDNDETFSFNHPITTIILKIALIIPLSNAHVERIFSQQNLIKSKLRNQMNIDTLNNHLMILLNGPEIEDFDFEKAYEHWVNKKPRKISCES